MPIPLGTTVVIPGREDTDRWEVTVLEVTPDATDSILAAWRANEPPEEGNQFHLVTLRVTYIGTGSSEFDGRLKLLGQSGVVYESFETDCGYDPGYLNTLVELFPGGTIEGSICREIKSSDVDSLVMILDPPFSYGGEGRVWMGLAE